MKFVDLDEIYKRYPNKYVALVLASKEVRKIIEANKPPPLPKEDEEITVVAKPDITILEPPAPKKRGRKPKKPATEAVEEQKPVPPKIVTEEEVLPIQTNGPVKGFGVRAEKTQENPYIAGLKKILD